MATRFVRTSKGGVVHRADCPQLRNPRTRAYPWIWAEDKTDAQIANSCRYIGIRPCRTCKPLEES